MYNKIPETEYLKNIFKYEDGKLFWKVRPVEHFKNKRTASMWNAKFANKQAGRQMKLINYRQVMVDGVRYLEHRIIAKLHGIDTSKEIDHIDGNGLNNRFENLRPANRSQNNRNTSCKKNKNLRVGVGKNGSGKFISYIREDGKHRYLGTYENYESACAARVSAEIAIYGEYSIELSRFQKLLGSSSE